MGPSNELHKDGIFQRNRAKNVILATAIIYTLKFGSCVGKQKCIAEFLFEIETQQCTDMTFIPNFRF